MHHAACVNSPRVPRRWTNAEEETPEREHPGRITIALRMSVRLRGAFTSATPAAGSSMSA